MEEYDNAEYRERARQKAISNGENDVDIEALKEIVSQATQGPWHWVLHDYSMGDIQGPAEEWDHVMSVSPCEACQKRAKTKGEEWQWGICTCPSEANGKLLALAPAIAEALIQKSKYPIIVETNIYQYDEGVFVWFDETGGVGGASNYLEEARDQMKRYSLNM